MKNYIELAQNLYKYYIGLYKIVGNLKLIITFFKSLKVLKFANYYILENTFTLLF